MAQARLRDGSRPRETTLRGALAIELVRVVLLVAAVVLIVVVALPALIELAAAPYR